MLLTTCYKPSKLMFHFLADMLEVLPCAQFFKRQVSKDIHPREHGKICQHTTHIIKGKHMSVEDMHVARGPAMTTWEEVKATAARKSIYGEYLSTKQDACRTEAVPGCYAWHRKPLKFV